MRSTLPPSPAIAPTVWSVSIPCEDARLPGKLTIPPQASSLVLFAHGSGSSRHSPRNQFVADVLHQAGMATLLFDLLTEHESEDRRNVFDVRRLADRLLSAIGWSSARHATGHLPIGLFGASTGGGAAIIAATQQPLVRAIVSRGGRPDLAGPWLAHLTAPTLLLVGSEDTEVLALNRQALASMRGPHHLSVVPGATPLCQEPGALEEVAGLARAWFAAHLTHGGTP